MLGTAVAPALVLLLLPDQCCSGWSPGAPVPVGHAGEETQGVSPSWPMHVPQIPGQPGGSVGRAVLWLARIRQWPRHSGPELVAHYRG
jgi:hypothetical protein